MLWTVQLASHCFSLGVQQTLPRDRTSRGGQVEPHAETNRCGAKRMAGGLAEYEPGTARTHVKMAPSERAINTG